MPQTPEAHDRIRAVYDRYEPPPNEKRDWQGGWKKRVHDWLMKHSRHFREELVRRAASIGFNGHHIDVKAMFALRDLIKMDWQAANEILQRLLDGDDQILKTYAVTLLHSRAGSSGDHEEESRWRKRLKAVAEDRAAPGFARNQALETLLVSSWPGKDEWYLGLFSDETLLTLDDNLHPARPLQKPVRRRPDKWIPVMVKMVGDPNKAVRSHAANCLAQFNLGSAREDALRAILPWLADPSWAEPAALERLRLIQSLDLVNLPESVPGLIKVAERESDFYLTGAAEALAHYGAKEAVPALKEAIAREDDAYHRRKVVKAIAALDGFTAEEAAAAITAYAVHYSSPEGQRETDDAITTIIYRKTVLPAVGIGETVSDSEYARDEVAARLLGEMAGPLSSNTEACQMLSRILSRWPVPSADRHFVGLITTGAIGLDNLVPLLAHRESVAAHAGPELHALVRRGGAKAGVAAALVGDADIIQAILSGRDPHAHRALLACARVIRLPLPVGEIGQLLDRADESVSLAAERYLESEDGPQARQIVLARHRGEYRIIGAFSDDDPRWLGYLGFDAAEDHMRREMQIVDAPDEMFALLAFSTWGPCTQIFVYVRERDEGRIVVYEPDCGPALRRLSPDELSELLEFVRERRIDDLAPYNIMAMDGIEYEYVHLTQLGGRRVYMNNPPGGSDGAPGVFMADEGAGNARPDIYGELVAAFKDLASSGDFVTVPSGTEATGD